MSIDYIWRSRSRGAITPVAGASYQEIYCNGSYKHNSTGLSSSYSQGDASVCIDTVHPNFHKRKLAGEIMNTPISLHRDVFAGQNTSNYTITYVNPNHTCTGTNFIKQMSGQSHLRNMNLTPGYGCPYDWYKELESNQMAVSVGTKAWAGIQAPHVQGTVLAAELGKTFAMLASPLKNLRRLIEQIKKSKRYKRWTVEQRRAHRIASVSQFISDEWLRYRYGIVPLMMDIDGIMKLLAESVVSPRLTSRASGSFESDDLMATTSYSEGSSGYFAGSTITTRKVKVRISCGILYEHQASAQSRYGYDLSQQASAIWELIPYSFLVDWAVNIGDTIEAFSHKAGVKVLAQWTTTHVVDAKSAVANAYGTPPSQYFTVTGALNAAAYHTYSFYGRQPVCQRGLVNLTKQWDLRRTKEQIRSLDAAALLLNAIRSR